MRVTPCVVWELLDPTLIIHRFQRKNGAMLVEFKNGVVIEDEPENIAQLLMGIHHFLYYAMKDDSWRVQIRAAFELCVNECDVGPMAFPTFADHELIRVHPRKAFLLIACGFWERDLVPQLLEKSEEELIEILEYVMADDDDDSETSEHDEDEDDKVTEAAVCVSA